MKATRREFLWTASAAAAGLAWHRAQDVAWPAEEAAQAGWAPGLESRATSACLLCPARCGIEGRVVDGRLVRIMGNRLHPISRGGLCPRGIGAVQVLYHPERLATPLRRTGERGEGHWQAISAEEAVSLIAERLRGMRADGRGQRLAVLAGYCAGSMEALWRQFCQAYGTPNYLADDYTDGTEAVTALMHGRPGRPGYDLERSRLVLSFGAPLFDAWWSPLQAHVAFAGRGVASATRPRFVQVDTRFSHSAALAHEWVGVRPGTHAILALGIAYVLIKEELTDARFLADHVAGFDEWVDEAGRVHEGYSALVLRNYRTEEVSAITGVPVERIVALAKSFAEAKPAVAVCGSDVLHAPDGLLQGLAVHSLNVLTGNINRAGTVLFGDGPPLAPMADSVLDAAARAGRAAQPVAPPAPLGPGDPALRLAEAVAGGAPLEALFLYYANPLASSSHPEAWKTALDRIPFVVSFSPFLDESARQADLILPDLTPYERWQDAPAPASYGYPVWALAHPLVEPRGRGVATGNAVLALARELGGSVAQSLPYADVEALLRERARGLFEVRRGMTFGDEFARTHYRQMEDRGWWLAEETDFESFWEKLVTQGGWSDPFYDETDPARMARTPSGRIELLPTRLRELLRTDAAGRQAYVLVPGPGSSPTTEYPLRLIPFRLSTLSSGSLTLERWLAEQPSILPERYWHPWIEVNPATAAALGVGEDALVWVSSARGRYRARVKLFPGAAPETVCAPYGLKHPGGELANPLQLLDGTTDPLTGRPAWFTTFVRLDPAPGVTA